MYAGMFMGHSYGCDCIGICGYYMDGCYKMHAFERCDRNQTMYGCREFSPFPPVRMNQHGKSRVCGRNDGIVFLNATRPDITTGQCPDGQAPCSTKTDLQTTICYDKSKDPKVVCPITDIKFIENVAVPDYEASGYSSRPFNETASLVFSKDAPNLPITETRVEYQPCMDSLYTSTSPH